MVASDTAEFGCADIHQTVAGKTGVAGSPPQVSMYSMPGSPMKKLSNGGLKEAPVKEMLQCHIDVVVDGKFRTKSTDVDINSKSPSRHVIKQAAPASSRHLR